MKIPADISARIDSLRFPLIIGIAFLHAYAPFTFGTVKTVPVPVKTIGLFFSSILGHISVPLFFIISGYLFFNNYSLTGDCYRKKTGSRIRSLMVPFIIWNVAVMAVKTIILSVPQLSHLDNHPDGFTFELSPGGILIFIYRFFNDPAAGQFWFLRDLFIFSMISPVLWFMLKRVPWLGIVLFLPLWFLRITYPLMVLDEIYRSLPFFYIGGLLVTRKLDLARFDGYVTPAGLLYGVLIIVDLFVLVSFRSDSCPLFILFILHHVTVSAGIVLAWIVTSKISKGIMQLLLKLSPYALFVFCAQLPFLDILQKVWFHVLSPTTSPGYLLLYFGTTTVTVTATLVTGIVIRKFAPPVYSLLTGGRR